MKKNLLFGIVLAASAAVAGESAAERELKLHLALFKDLPQAIVWKVGERPSDDATPLKPEECRWQVKGNTVWLYGEGADGDKRAVDDFLETRLGVRWPWGGEIAVHGVPRDAFSEGKGGWVPELRKRVLRTTSADGLEWSARLGSGAHDEPAMGHAFTKYWAMYATKYPEIFAMRKDGKRLPSDAPDNLENPAEYHGNNGESISMCVSSDKLVELVLENWRAKGRPKYICVCENDAMGKTICQCEKCKALDVPPPPEMRSWWPDCYADRYVHFAKRVLNAARKERKDAVVTFYGYNATERAPRRERLVEGLIPTLVPTLFTKEWVHDYLKSWKDAGATEIGYRPNRHLYWGSILPLGCEEHFFDIFQDAYRQGSIAFDYDCADKAHELDYFKDYFLWKAMRDPTKDFAHWEDHYCEAFGAAKEQVKAYFRFWRENVFAALKPHIEEFTLEGRWWFFVRGIYGYAHRATNKTKKFFSAAMFDQTDAILKDALNAVGDDAGDVRRVQALIKMNYHFRLTFKAMTDKCAENAKALYDFRKENGIKPRPWLEMANGDYCGMREFLPKATVVYEGNVPKIEVDDKRIDPWINTAGVKSELRVQALPRLSEAGFHIQEIQFHDSMYKSGFEVAPGKYTFSALDREAKQILNAAPKDYLVLNFDLGFPKWLAQHPEEAIGYQVAAKDLKVNPADEFSGVPKRVSAASQAYRKELSNFFYQLGDYIKDKSWFDRVIGYRVIWGVYTEWHYFGHKNGVDVSNPMMEAFHKYKGGKWAGAAAPTLTERRGTPGALMLDAAKDEKAIDYFACLNEQVRDLLLFMAHEAKKALPGRLVGAYYGYPFNYFLPEGQNCILEGVLDSPDIDFCSVPASYLAEVRAPGGTYHHRTITDAFKRRGKLVMLEDDTRHFHVKEWAARQYFSPDAEAAYAITLRNVLLTGLDGCGIQLCDPFGGWQTRTNTFDHPAILSAMKAGREALRKVKIPAESGNTLAVVVSPRERLLWANAIENMISRDISSNIPHYLYSSGAAGDIIALEDFLRTDKTWKNVIFPDCYTLNAAEIARLKEKLRDSKSVWFVREPPIEGANHRRIAEIPSGNNTLGDPKDQRDMTSAAKAWGEMLFQLGEHIWSKPGECMRRQGNVVMMSLKAAGKHRLRLPAPYCGATEILSGKEYTGQVIDFETTGPDTALFVLH